MTESSARYLLQRFFRDQCTLEEKAELARWVKQSATDSSIKEKLEEAWKEYEPLESLAEFKADAILSGIFSHSRSMEPIETRPHDKFVLWKRMSVAAIVVLLLATGGYFLMFENHKQETAKVTKLPTRVYTDNDALPGKHKAILTLSDGSKIILDSASIGVIAQQGNTKVINSKGELVYSSNNVDLIKSGIENKNKTILYNTLNTNRGELYPLVLSDKSTVWLNAGSSIRFPVAFYGGDRIVEITGEAYFEVTKNASQPFRVKLNGMEIEVLGTHFNVNAYADESAIKTTLLEGAVKITQGNASLLLSPGQQAGLIPNERIKLMKNVDLEEATSWKDGYFHFNNASLETVMRQLSRWYDVDVIYESKESRQYFGGDIEKNLQLSQALKILEKSQVHCKIEGKRLIVLR